MEAKIIIATGLLLIYLAVISPLFVDLFKRKTNQFTMRNPPKPPKTEYEVYCELRLERIELIKKISEVDFKINEILSKQPTWYKNQQYETALKSMSNNLKDVMSE